MPAKFRVEITRSAERDAEDIWTFIAKDNPRNAEKFIEKLENQVATLEKFPRRCPLIPETKIVGGQYRHLLYEKYRTIFRIQGSVVIVLRVIHGARLLELPSLLHPA